MWRSEPVKGRGIFVLLSLDAIFPVHQMPGILKNLSFFSACKQQIHANSLSKHLSSVWKLPRAEKCSGVKMWNLWHKPCSCHFRMQQVRGWMDFFSLWRMLCLVGVRRKAFRSWKVKKERKKETMWYVSVYACMFLCNWLLWLCNDQT